MSDPAPPPPPVRPAGHPISDRAALEAAIAGAAGLVLGRVLLGRGAGLLAGTAAIAARLVSAALKAPQEPPPPDPPPTAAPPVEVEDVGAIPEPGAESDVPSVLANAMGRAGNGNGGAGTDSAAEEIFVEWPPAAAEVPGSSSSAPPSSQPSSAGHPLPAFPSWEALAPRQTTELPGSQAAGTGTPEPVHASHPAAPAVPFEETGPLPAFPESADLADPEAIWKMAAAESAPLPERAAAPDGEKASAPPDNPFAALFASYGGTPAAPAAPVAPPAVPFHAEPAAALPASQGVPGPSPATGWPGKPEVAEPLPVSLPTDPPLTASREEAFTPLGEPPKVPPVPPPAPGAGSPAGTGTSSAVQAPADLPLLSLKVPPQTLPGSSVSVAGPVSQVTAPIEIVEAAGKEALGTPAPRQEGPPPLEVPIQPPRDWAWKAWLLVILLAGGMALFYWKAKRTTASPPQIPPAAGSSSSAAPSFSVPALPPPASSSTLPPATVLGEPAAPEAGRPVPGGASPPAESPPPAPPGGSTPKAAVAPEPALVAEPAPGVPQDFPPGSPEAIARQTLETLLSAKSVRELAPLVHQPAEAARLANLYFPDGDLRPTPYQRILFDAAESLPGSGLKSRLFRVVTSASPLGFPVAVEDTKNGPRVDFDAFIQCRDRHLDAFMAQSSALPGRYLVVLRRGHYFGEDLKPEVLDRLLCLDISSPLPDSAKYPVFIPRSTELGKLAQRKFAWDQVYTPVVELSHSGTYVSLTAILQDTWQRQRR